MDRYIPNFPKLSRCYLANSNICLLKDTNNICRNDINNGIKDCTEDEIENTNYENGLFERKSYKGVIIIIGSGALILILVIIIVIFYIYKKHTKVEENIMSNDYSI